MADCTYTISAKTTEVASSFAHTPVTIQFGAVMRDLAAYIEAERDLEHCDSWDPACDAWIRDAERARAHVLDAITALHGTPVCRCEDQPLKRLGQMAQMLIESDSPEQVRDILALPDRFPHAFLCAGTDPVARRVNLMVAGFQQHLHALATLEDVADMVEADCFVVEPDTPATMLAPAA
ncbi:hypothetical protein SAMN05421641_1335 [Paracoccus thiocyanatus]|uniref:Uncharacterized protein n=1 Tax=Paracoccus thiocyanatus TaxID=34006 RepID=A0A1N6ZC17_9RHOB|nr:hypothetical protein [Paracoccus thiocyanatus]SIR24328.1 hypothetical protein SAMN05421641_1335 [Paracoccus thiocyanatus]